MKLGLSTPASSPSLPDVGKGRAFVAWYDDDGKLRYRIVSRHAVLELVAANDTDG